MMMTVKKRLAAETKFSTQLCAIWLPFRFENEVARGREHAIESQWPGDNLYLADACFADFARDRRIA